MDDILNVLSERIEKAVGEINRLRNERDGLINRVRELEGEKEQVSNSANEKFGAFTGRIEEIIRKLDNIA
jgi:uncharacterized coiled-coil DUF342 family protein